MATVPGRLACAHVILFAAATAAAAAAPQVGEPGGIAPEYVWYVRDGCAARTAATLTPAADGLLKEAWRRSFDGTIEGEPLIWNETIVVCEREGDGRRALHVVRLSDGKKLMSREYKTTLPLAPSLWNRMVVVRSGPSELEVLAIGYSRLFPKGTVEVEGGPLGEPLLYGLEVYVRAGDALVRYDATDRSERWRFTGQLRGRPALRGDHVYVVSYDGGGTASLVAIRRADGREAARAEAGHHGGAVPPWDGETSIHVGESRVLVRHALGVPLQGGEAWNTVLVDRAGGGTVLRSAGVIDTASRVAVGPDATLALGRRDGRTAWIQNPDGEASTVLAQPGSHEELLQSPGHPVIAGEAGIVRGCAFVLETSRVLWRVGPSAVGRAVPVRGGALTVASGGQELVAWRAMVAERPRGEAAVAAEAAELPKGRAVLAGGVVAEGDFVLHGAERRLERTAPRSRRASWPLSEVPYVEDAAGRPVYWSGARALGRAARELFEHEVAEGYADLAKASRGSNDPALMRRLLREAWSRGADDRGLASVERKLDGITKRKRAPKVRSSVVDRVLGDEAEIVPRAVESLWRRRESLPETAHRRVRNALTRTTLRIDPEHAEAVKAARAVVPEGLDAPEPFAALDWLAFDDVVSQVPIEIVSLPGRDDDDPPWESRELFTARRTWRPAPRRDILGIKSERLLILASARSPGRIARWLLNGEYVCQVLEEIFAGGEHRRDARTPLLLYLHDSNEDYLANSEGASHLGWTAGHYSVFRGVSRMFVPEGHDAFRRVLDVFAHELTHHWIDVRCPLFSSGRSRGTGPVRGYWIVEGFASFIEEAGLGPLEQVFDPADPRGSSLDVVCNVPEGKLLPWDLLFGATHQDFARLEKSREKGVEVPLRSRLGVYRRVNATALFYDQATVAVKYLYLADDGRRRQDLLAYLAAYETGAGEDELDVEKVFGLSPAELGKRSLAFARKLYEAAP